MLFTRSGCLSFRLYGRVLSMDHRRPVRALERACLPVSRQLDGGRAREASVEARREETSTRRPAARPDFQNAKVIYDKRSFSELLRSYFVFSLCSVDIFVDHQARILALLRRLLGRRLFVAVMKKTIFGQFMVSDESEAVLRLAKRHSQSGVTPLFAYTAAEFHGGHSGTSAKSSRDVWCQGNFNAIASSIEMANKCKEFTKDQPVVTTKLTFLTDYADLRNLTEVINQQTKLIEGCLMEKRESSGVGNCRPLIEYLLRVARSARDDELASMTTCINVDNKATRLTRYQLVGLLSSACFHVALNRFIQKNPMPWVREGESSVIRLREEDLQRISRLWSRMNELNKMASERKTVVINYDAEQTFIQPAIEALVLDSMRIFNKQRPVVLNTYQCYLKRTLGFLKRDLELCREEGFCFGGKVVRGAYMDEERRLAKHNYPDPVNDSYEITTDVYCKAIDSVLADATNTPPSSSSSSSFSSSSSSSSSLESAKPMRMIVATHNLDTVNFVIERLRDKKLDARESGISFAQLLGTRDYISFALGAAGYPAGKLIHYAEPESGLAYLSRRLQENRSGLPSPAIERRLLTNEIKRRFLRRP